MTFRSFYGLRDERGVFRLSITMTILVAGLGVVMGILSGSASIMFDGIYSLLDSVMSLLSLFVAKLILSDTQSGFLSERIRRRFSMGFWHLEPIVLGLNGTLLIAVAVYALVNALGTIFEGGTELHMGAAIAYAAVTLVLCVTMARVATVANRQLGSALIALTSRAGSSRPASRARCWSPSGSPCCCRAQAWTGWCPMSIRPRW